MAAFVFLGFLEEGSGMHIAKERQHHGHNHHSHEELVVGN
jgi:hypothetical protein